MEYVSAKRDQARVGQGGSVLLLALLIMTTVLITSSGLSALMLSSLQQTRIIDNSVVAYYAAETAVEDALFGILRSEDGIPGSRTTPQALTNRASWSREVSTEERAIFTVISEDQFVEISLYDPTASLTATDITRVRVWWTDECGGCSAMQGSLVGWLPGGSLTWRDSFGAATHRVSSADSPVSFSLDDPYRLYRLRLKALNADLKNVEIRAYDDSNNPIDIPGRIKISARGFYVGTQQRITVTLPQELPSSGLFDYVVFSECSLVKGGPTTCPSSPLP